jgi:hypothetical protein
MPIENSHLRLVQGPPAAAVVREDALEAALRAVAHLDVAQLEQLRAHVSDLLDALRPPAPSAPAVPPLPEPGLPRGSRGGGVIEWKRIRRGDKLFGPYPYWRVHAGKHHRSLYLKALAQAARAAPSG